jgi:hypothetical protein
MSKEACEVWSEVLSEVASEVGVDNGLIVTSTTPGTTPAGRLGAGKMTDDWWCVSERLADLAQEVAGAELAANARMALVEATVELLVLLTCWPSSPTPANPLVNLRARRARMERHASWFYALPRPTRSLLAGTRRRPALVAFAVRAQPVDGSLRRAWRKGLVALEEHVANRDNAPNEVIELAEPMRALPRRAHELVWSPRARCSGAGPRSNGAAMPGPTAPTTAALVPRQEHWCSERECCRGRRVAALALSERAAPGLAMADRLHAARRTTHVLAARGPPGPPPVPMCLACQSVHQWQRQGQLPASRARCCRGSPRGHGHAPRGRGRRPSR